jgi:alkaline phosphatase D
MKRRNFIKQVGALSGSVLMSSYITPGFASSFGDNNFIPRLDKVTLPEAHIGNLEIDTRLMDSYGLLPENIRNFYLSSRSWFSKNEDASFTDSEIIKAAQENNLPLMGGPMLSKLETDEVTIWIRPATDNTLKIKISSANGLSHKSYEVKKVQPGVEQRIKLDKLLSDTKYEYTIMSDSKNIAEGNFTTAPDSNEKGIYRVAFGSCFHKVGLHNPNLTHQIVKRNPMAMMLLGDIATDDRENHANMLYSDYLLRDIAKSWKHLASNVPLYTMWDDHDYYNNDISGIPDGCTSKDVDMLRSVWQQNWNNPENKGEVLYFSTRMGPVELIMTDTRSCRERERRGEYGCYLGKDQQEWLKKTLKESTAPFKIISSGTMWSDYMSKAKDSWGTWDKEAREEIFSFIEKENIPGVLLISGDRHGARSFTIPRQSGNSFYEFEAASLGGVRGPKAMAEDHSTQLFGYEGPDIIGFGEFTFDTTDDKPLATFRLIDERGEIREEHKLPYSKLVH